MRLADLQAKPDANHANPHPHVSLLVSDLHQPCAPPAFADLVANPIPPGQIARDWALLVNDQLAREIGWQGL